ncbi:MAG: 30S ribosomal protein S27ae [Candidatus Bathyarchaeota archaeon]|nr:MAG: 30S ribosomal protein S27ae [Candidatus Bathyarchaeota archaeon]
MTEQSDEPKPEDEETQPVEEEIEKEQTTEPIESKTEKKKKVKASKKIFTFYKMEQKGITRLRPFCERCGPGYFMANHTDRYTCGHCGFTRYKQVEE